MKLMTWISEEITQIVTKHKWKEKIPSNSFYFILFEQTISEINVTLKAVQET